MIWQDNSTTRTTATNLHCWMNQSSEYCNNAIHGSTSFTGVKHLCVSTPRFFQIQYNHHQYKVKINLLHLSLVTPWQTVGQ